jgi:hypothetical protein
MEENILPDDMQEMLLPEVNKTKSVQFARPDNSPPQQSYLPPQQSYLPPQQSYLPPQQSYLPPQQSQQNYLPPQQSQQPQQSQNSNSNNIKKKNAFVKMSNNVSKYPKCYLILIIILILIILIIFIYYRGLLFLGPYCSNNVRSAKFKNRELQKDSISSSKNKDDKLMQSLKL